MRVLRVVERETTALHEILFVMSMAVAVQCELQGIVSCSDLQHP